MSRIRLAHPRRSRLRAWLETGSGERITEHVEHCDRCAHVLEQLADESGAPAIGPGGALGDAIRAAMPPPEDLNERVLQRIASRQRAERELSLFLGLIAIPRDAVDLMMPPPAPRRPGSPEIAPGNDEQREEPE